FTGDVQVSLAAVGDAGTSDGGANGLSMAPVTIGSTTTIGTAHISASATAALGKQQLSFVVTTGTTATVVLPIVVAGAPGTLDTTFGVNGVVADQPGGVAYGVACADDGHVYVIGGSGPWLVRRYDENGAADPTFDNAIKTNATGAGRGSRIAVQGSMLAVGGGDGSNALTIRRVTTSGAIDATFGTSGTFNVKVGSQAAKGTLTDLAFTASGDVLATADVSMPSDDGFAYRIHGSTADKIEYSTTVDPGGIALDGAGKIVVSGSLHTADAGVQLWTQKLDDSFADAGTASSGTKGQFLSDGTIAVTSTRIGVFGGYNAGNGHSLAVFDVSSLAVVSAAASIDHAGTYDVPFTGAAAEPDGKMVGCGSNGGSQSEFAYVSRFDADGSKDTSFGDSGDFKVGGFSGAPTTKFNDVAVDAWGRIVVVGSDSSVGMYVARIWP
ncbi:MAG TPA: hypothetical protein VF407_06095, partial [Polyangiaceae bacterium]